MEYFPHSLYLGAERSGVGKAIPAFNPDLSRTTIVAQKGYAIGHPRVTGANYLATDGLSQCVALAASNPSTRLSFLSHIDRAASVRHAFSLIEEWCGKGSRLAKAGGWGSRDKPDGASLEIIEEVESYEHEYEVIGNDIFGCPDLIEVNGGKFRRLRAVGIESATGWLFVPHLLLPSDNAKFYGASGRLAISHDDLENDGLPLDIFRQIKH